MRRCCVGRMVLQTQGRTAVLMATPRNGSGPTGEMNVTVHIVPLAVVGPSGRVKAALETDTLSVLLSGPMMVCSAAVRDVAVIGAGTSTHFCPNMFKDVTPPWSVEAMKNACTSRT